MAPVLREVAKNINWKKRQAPVYTIKTQTKIEYKIKS